MLNPVRASIWASALRIAAIFVGAVLALALMLTLAPRVLLLHPSGASYAVLAALGVLLVLAVLGLAQLYVQNVSIQVLDGALVIRDFRGQRRALPLGGLLAVELVPVVFEWLFVKLDWRYVVVISRARTCVQTLDIAEWEEPAMEHLLDQLRLSGMSIRNNLESRPLDLISGLGRHYPGATRVRSGPYSLIATSIAILIFGAGVVATLPFSLR